MGFLLRRTRIPSSPPKRVQSRRWRSTARQHLQAYGKCAACGSRSRLRVHHIEPVSVNPAREFDPSNLITLCESYENGVNCHLFFGHGGDWASWNPRVVADALNYRQARLLRSVS